MFNLYKNIPSGSPEEIRRTWLLTLGVCAAPFIVLTPVVKYFRIGPIDQRAEDIGRAWDTINALKKEAAQIHTDAGKVPVEKLERMADLERQNNEWAEKRRKKKSGQEGVPYTNKEMIREQQKINAELNGLKDSVWQEAVKTPHTPRLKAIASRLEVAQEHVQTLKGHWLASPVLFIAYKFFHWIIFAVWALSAGVFVITLTIGSIGVWSKT